MPDSLPPDRLRYWTPISENIQAALRMAHGRIVDLCPGGYPFPHPDAIRCGWGADGTDIAKDRLPFETQSVDFLYCRHTLEDLLDPAWALSEISRVAKSGWIETPSIISELCRGVDAGNAPWRGYVHHRSLFWVEGDTLVTCAKYPMAEYMSFNEDAPDRLQDPAAWNCVYTFRDGLCRWNQLRHEQEYRLPNQYAAVLQRGLSANAQTPQDPPTSDR
jgi:hypothetical protein